MTNFSLQVLLFNAVTTTMLSQQATACPAFPVITAGYAYYYYWHHFFNCDEQSVVVFFLLYGEQVVFKSSPTPLWLGGIRCHYTCAWWNDQSSIIPGIFHQAKSDQNSTDKHMWCCCFAIFKEGIACPPLANDSTDMLKSSNKWF